MLVRRAGERAGSDLGAAKTYLVETEIKVGGKTLYRTPELVD